MAYRRAGCNRRASGSVPAAPPWWQGSCCMTGTASSRADEDRGMNLPHFSTANQATRPDAARQAGQDDAVPPAVPPAEAPPYTGLPATGP